MQARGLRAHLFKQCAVSEAFRCVRQVQLTRQRPHGRGPRRGHSFKGPSTTGKFSQNKNRRHESAILVAAWCSGLVGYIIEISIATCHRKRTYAGDVRWIMSMRRWLFVRWLVDITHNRRTRGTSIRTPRARDAPCQKTSGFNGVCVRALRLIALRAAGDTHTHTRSTLRRAAAEGFAVAGGCGFRVTGVRTPAVTLAAPSSLLAGLARVGCRVI